MKWKSALVAVGFIVVVLVGFYSYNRSDTASGEIVETQVIVDQPKRESVSTLINEFSVETFNDEEILAQLTSLRAGLFSLPKSEAVALIENYLGTGEDVLTGFDFTVSDSRDGTLSMAPSLRVALLDFLGRIDPEAAGAASIKILEESSSADEWAISMRNVAEGFANGEKDVFLKSKLTELLSNEEWKESPTVGYFEAFDFIVHTGHVEAIPQLADFFEEEDRRDLGYAAFLTLDRLTITDTKGALQALLGQSKLLSRQGEMTANLFARADIRDESERNLLAEYLLSEDRTEAELAAFSGVYPNGNYIQSNNLVTRLPARNGVDLQKHDKEALEWIGRWITEPRFQSIRPSLEASRNRLLNFVSQGERSDDSPKP